MSAPASAALQQQRAQQTPAVAQALGVRVHAQIQQVRLAGGDRHDAVARHAAADVEHQAVVAGQQAIAKDAEAPGILIGRALDGRDRLQVGRLHQANLRTRMDGGAHGDWLSSSLTMQRSVHAFAFVERAAKKIRRVIRDDQRRVALAVADERGRAAYRSGYPSATTTAPRCGRRRAARAAATSAICCDRYGVQRRRLARAADRDCSAAGTSGCSRCRPRERGKPIARSIAFSSWPARPTNGSPCRSSSAPGASPITNKLRVAPADAEHRLRAARDAARHSVHARTFAASSDHTSSRAAAPRSRGRVVRGAAQRRRGARRCGARPRAQPPDGNADLREIALAQPRSWRHRVVPLAAAVPQPRRRARCRIDDEQRENRHGRLDRDDDDHERNQAAAARTASVCPGFTSLKLTYANRDIISSPVTAVIVIPATSAASPSNPRTPSRATSSTQRRQPPPGSRDPGRTAGPARRCC